MAAHRGQGASAIGAYQTGGNAEPEHVSTSPVLVSAGHCRVIHRVAEQVAEEREAVQRLTSHRSHADSLPDLTYRSRAHHVHPRRVGMVPSRHLVDHREDARSHEPACDRNDCSVRHEVFAYKTSASVVGSDVPCSIIVAR